MPSIATPSSFPSLLITTMPPSLAPPSRGGTTSYVNLDMWVPHGEAVKKGIMYLNEIGLDPGIDNLYVVKTIRGVHDKGGKVRYRIVKLLTHLN